MTTKPPPDSSSTSEGLLHLLPVPLRAGIQVEATVASLLPWGSPALLGLSASNAEGEPLLVIGYEWPIPWARVTSPLNKGEIESLQLERFRTDYILGTKALPFVEAVPGSDPPDFLVSTERGTMGVECTSFTVADRREALALFGRVRGTLVQRPRPELLHLGGFIIYVWFGRPGGLERPFRKDDDEAVAELIQALVDTDPRVSVGGSVRDQDIGAPHEADPSGGTASSRNGMHSPA